MTPADPALTPAEIRAHKAAVRARPPRRPPARWQFINGKGWVERICHDPSVWREAAE
jgi:hypothetical protein